MRRGEQRDRASRRGRARRAGASTGRRPAPATRARRSPSPGPAARSRRSARSSGSADSSARETPAEVLAAPGLLGERGGGPGDERRDRAPARRRSRLPDVQQPQVAVGDVAVAQRPADPGQHLEVGVGGDAHRAVRPGDAVALEVVAHLPRGAPAQDGLLADACRCRRAARRTPAAGTSGPPASRTRPAPGRSRRRSPADRWHLYICMTACHTARYARQWPCLNWRFRLETCLGQLLLAASRSALVRRSVSGFPLTRKVVDRFVAGESVAQARDAVRAAARRRVSPSPSTISARRPATRAPPAATAEGVRHAAGRAAPAGARRPGRGVGEAVGRRAGPRTTTMALEHAREICAAADAAGATVTLDMEDHTTVDSTLAHPARAARGLPVDRRGHPGLPVPQRGRLPRPRRRGLPGTAGQGRLRRARLGRPPEQDRGRQGVRAVPAHPHVGRRGIPWWRRTTTG